MRKYKTTIFFLTDMMLVLDQANITSHIYICCLVVINCTRRPCCLLSLILYTTFQKGNGWCFIFERETEQIYSENSENSATKPLIPSSKYFRWVRSLVLDLRNILYWFSILCRKVCPGLDH